MRQTDYCLVACDSGSYHAQELDAILKGDHGYQGIRDSREMNFDGEIEPRIFEHVRDMRVYVVQACIDPLSSRTINDNLMAFLLTIQAVSKAHAGYVVGILGSLPYDRQDRRTGIEQGIRKSIGVKLVADCIQVAGANGLIFYDPHNPASEVAFSNGFKLDYLFTKKILLDSAKNLFPSYFTDLENLVISSVDLGGTKRAGNYAKTISCEKAIIEKERDPETGEIKGRNIVGKVSNKRVIVVDDKIASAGSLVEAGKMLVDNGANEMIVLVSHAELGGSAISRLDALYASGFMKGVIATDTIYHGASFPNEHPWFHYAKIAPTTAKVIRSHALSVSMHSMLD